MISCAPCRRFRRGLRQACRTGPLCPPSSDTSSRLISPYCLITPHLIVAAPNKYGLPTIYHPPSPLLPSPLPGSFGFPASHGHRILYCLWFFLMETNPFWTPTRRILLLKFTHPPRFWHTYSPRAELCTGVCLWIAYFWQKLANHTQTPLQSSAPGASIYVISLALHLALAFIYELPNFDKNTQIIHKPLCKMMRQTDYIDWCTRRCILHKGLCINTPHKKFPMQNEFNELNWI